MTQTCSMKIKEARMKIDPDILAFAVIAGCISVFMAVVMIVALSYVR